jgi:hypothetical protein
LSPTVNGKSRASDDAPRGARYADAITRFMGSWKLLHHVAALEARILEMEATILAGLDAAKSSPREPR